MNILVFYCTLLISNKNILSHLGTLVYIKSYYCATILTFYQQKIENLKSVGNFFLSLEKKSVKTGQDKISKNGGKQDWYNQKFLKKMEEELTYILEENN